MSDPLFPAEEVSFLRTILDMPEDRNILLVYADWLDDRADPRAEFVRLLAARLELNASDPAREEIDSRLAQLRDELDPRWIMVFDPAWVQNCYGCSWLDMAPTDLLDIRICRSCRQSVIYCHTLDESRLYASCGQQVALASRVAGEWPTELPGQASDPEVEIDIEEFLDVEPPAGPPLAPEPPRPWWRFW